MSIDWPEHAKSLSPGLKELRGGAGDVMRGFSAIAQAALRPGALDTKTKELIALAVGIATRCDDCIAFHVKAALEHGANREEVMETLGMAVYMGAGPAAMYAAHAAEAYRQFATPSSETTVAAS